MRVPLTLSLYAWNVRDPIISDGKKMLVKASRIRNVGILVQTLTDRLEHLGYIYQKILAHVHDSHCFVHWGLPYGSVWYDQNPDVNQNIPC